MAKRQKKRARNKKGSSSSSFKKSLKQATHPVPAEKIEGTGKKYDRKESKEQLKEEIDHSRNG
tara:strand:+ start:17544 stop:17732 length:189 start_codon:yes stop_codon:yes gene_type:complete